jgi:hypothetical protein
MNDEDIKQFMNAFEDFMEHANTEIDAHSKVGRGTASTLITSMKIRQQNLR